MTAATVKSKPKITTIRFGHSPDPDDAFMFYGIAKGKIPTSGFKIEHVVEDIESLNQRALGVGAYCNTPLHATAISVHAYAYLSDRYAIMRAGASIGEKYGPILVSKKPLKPGQLRGKTIAIPGLLTTAALVLKLFNPKLNTCVTPFDRILDHVAAGKVDAGLIIHEGQLTYASKKLHKVLDLGEWWWKKTKLPLPLGIDVIRRDLGLENMKRLSRIFKESIVYGLKNRKSALEYAIRFGRGLAPNLNDRFVGMYVNDYTVDLGKKGEAAIREILKQGTRKKILPKKTELVFV